MSSIRTISLHTERAVNQPTFWGDPYLLVCLVGVFLSWSGDVFAQAIFGSAAQRLCDAYRFGKGIIYVVAGIGILILGILAMLGRFQFGRFFAIAGGIFIASSAEQIIAMLGGGPSECSGSFGGGIGPPAGG